MKYIAAYLLVKSRGKENPNINDIRDIIESIGIEYDYRKAEDTVKRLNGKNINEVYKEEEIERLTSEILEEIKKHNSQPPIYGDNSACQDKSFGLIMTLRRKENEPVERYALTLIDDQNFLNSAGMKIDLQKEDIAHNAHQRWHFGCGEYNTVINPELHDDIVWDVADRYNLNPPEKTPFYTFPFHGRHNQHFIFKNNMIYARQNGHVVTYVGGDIPFVMMLPKDELKERQTFSIIPESLNIVEGPYTQWTGINKIEGATDDKFGNAQGSQYDLANDGAFKGYTIILVLQYDDIPQYSGPIEALKRKGFNVKVIHSPLRSGETSLQSLLTIENSQLWFISTDKNILSDSDIQAVKNYFLKGHGVYIWGDNAPIFKDANRLLENILGSSVQLSGDDYGDKVLSIQKTTNGEGIIPNHPISTGIMNFYEGITISSVPRCNEVTPLVYNSAGNILTSFYDKDRKRMMIDGGFTRLYTEYWNTAGTERLIVNAAAWLANIERFGYHPQK